MQKRFNIRVYGICFNENGSLLLSDEQYAGRSFTKFPGGGLDWGEGTKECLKREFQEEFQLEIEVKDLYYFTDIFQVSAFSENDQVISIYYQIDIQNNFETSSKTGDKGEKLRWVDIIDLTPDSVTFPIDRLVVGQILAQRKM